MDTPRLKFQNLLRELFQFDCADLDFGIYRIMNQKRALIEDFMEKDLVNAVAKELKNGSLKEQGDLAEQLATLAAKIREDIGDDAIDADGKLDPKHAGIRLGRQYLELQEKAAGSASISELESQVFNHLWAFFSRYYDNGDVLSTRRYSRREKYAIPYNGEEVYFHWANRDQYYIKTGEYFTDYQWKAGDVSVLFKLVQAETEKDNVKADKKRLFVPRLDEVSVNKKVVIIPFEYRALTEQEDISFGKKNQQDAIIEQALDSLPKRKALKQSPAALGALLEEYRKTEDGKSVSRLEHHLRRYSGKNTRDYFIHKDLEGFLTRELDFYLKNEVLALDDLESGGTERADSWFQLLQAIRAIGGKIIAFLAQVENFQKRIFEKRKFVTETNYCFTIDRVPKALWPKILKNKMQIEEWKKLYSIQDLKGYSDPLKQTFIEDWPSLMIDTKFFADDPDFVDTLLASQKDLEESLGGLLIHSENFQALNLLLPRFKEQVKCIYIDPPYNTSSSAIPYKNDYRHSAWGTMMYDRVALLRAAMTSDGAFFASIDKTERTLLEHLMDYVFGAANRVEELIWSMNTTNSQVPNYSTNHEYVQVYAKNRRVVEQDPDMFREPKPGFREVMDLIARLNPSYPSVASIESELRALYEQHKTAYRDDIESQGLEWDDEKGNDTWRGIFNYAHAEYRDSNDRLVPESEAKKREAQIRIWQEGDASMPATKQSPSTRDLKHPNWRFYKPKHPITGKPCPHPKSGWKFAYADDEDSPEKRSFVSLDRDHRIAWGLDETKVPRIKRMLHEVETNIGKSVFQDYSDGEKQTSALFGQSGIVLAPKHANFVARFIQHGARKDSVIFDCFGGSGSTAHAVVTVNRGDHGNRKYVIVEVANYFDSIIKPRMQKVAFSNDWRGGKPDIPKNGKSSGISHAFKYIQLESYEDALGNIAFEGPQGELKLDDYVLRYMLEFETRKSETLLNAEKLAAPFSYQLDIMDGAERKTKPISLPETFNYLLGLKVGSRQIHVRDGKHRYLVIRGMTNPHGEGGEREVVVIWRDVTGWKPADFKADAEFVKKKKLTNGADDVFVNADGVIPGARVLDPVFKERMFAPVAV
jgi:adenine-specific DNA-methyltransferase